MTVRGVWAVIALMLAALAASPGVAAAATCPQPKPSYTGPCGPTFAVPTWTDAGGWSDPSQFSTIQLADVNGDGRDELLGRSDAGIQVWWFDTGVGQWRPQVDANATPLILSDFRSPRPGETPATDWTKPEFYSTIQTAHLREGPGAQVVANFADGMRVYAFRPGPGGSINGGSWRLASSKSRVLAAGASPARYLSLHAVDPVDSGYPVLTDQNLFWRYRLYAFSARSGHTTTGAPVSSLPQYYLDNMNAVMPGPFGFAASNVYRTPDGVGVQTALSGNSWLPLGPAPTSGFACQAAKQCSPLTDTASPDCPAGATNCFGSSPAYYESMTVGNHLRGRDDPNGYVLGRLSDGLHVYGLTSVAFNTLGWDDSIPVLKDLADPSTGLPPVGTWASIRTGDIDGDGKAEVLALDGNGLEAWTYQPGTKSWAKLPGTLGLTDPWPTHEEYASTIRVGDVDGDGRAEVVARGPYGIRTWFYNRRGTGGWERYLDSGYAPFPTAGQQNAFTELTAQAKVNGAIVQNAKSVRDAWAGESAPTQSDMTTLQARLGNIGGCTGLSPASPPSYQACTPPATSSGFTAADWLAVINEMLAESDAAYQVVGFFGQLDVMRQKLFIAAGAELPAIGDDLALQAAADTQATFDFQSLFAGILGIAASFAGIEAPELSAALWVGSELASTIPQSSPTAMSNGLQSSYAKLQDKFATMITETNASGDAQSQLVRQDEGLLQLVGELQRSGTWAMDTIGMGSAANQGFATWVYSALIPTVYERYQITNCRDGFDYGNGQCSPPTGLGVIGGGQDFTMIGPPHQIDRFGAEQVPCLVEQDYSGSDDVCTWTSPPADLMNRVWGPVPPNCSYVPGQSDTVWTFGCSVGADVAKTIGDNRWDFPTFSGDPDPYNAPGGFTAVAGAPIRLGRPRSGQRRAVHGRALLRGGVTVPRRLALDGATVKLDRLLFERRGRGELTRPYRGRAARSVTLRLRRAAPGVFTAARQGRRKVRVTLRRSGRRGRARIALRLGGTEFRAPHACHALPASLALDTAPLHLESRLVIRHGRVRHRLRLEHRVRCGRDARGNVDRLVLVRNRSVRLRRGLAVSLRGPRSVRPGTSVRYTARLRNRRDGGGRTASSLWDVTLNDLRRTRRIRELRRGRSRSVSFTRRVPATARTPFCVHVVATAAGARATRARTCAAVADARAPASTG